MAVVPETIKRLRTTQDLQAAYEDLYNRLDQGKIDGKTSDNMNTVLKGASNIVVNVPMNYMKMYVLASKAKISIPPIMLPEGMRPKV